MVVAFGAIKTDSYKRIFKPAKTPIPGFTSQEPLAKETLERAASAHPEVAHISKDPERKTSPVWNQTIGKVKNLQRSG